MVNVSARRVAVNPARAGMILLGRTGARARDRKPRASGDDPICQAAILVAVT